MVMICNRKDIKTIQDKYNLNFQESVFKGDLSINHNDTYKISVDISSLPNFFPKVKELGERIPKKADRHVFEDGTCCLTTPAKEQLLIKTKIKNIHIFFDKILIPFFQNNSYYEINKEYIQGEYSHGIKGVIESYQEIAKVNDIELLIFFLYKIARKNKYNKNEKCFCKSGKKFKNCHSHAYKQLSLIDRRIITNDISKIFSFLEMIKKVNQPPFFV
ncbi:MAG: SEC-C domain-containing protein [Candidatus Electrothrix sp. GM3_4]|nr:SEC-C domain-containing protein [Candidatus Electrothrix sp. GM3_4]